MKSLPRSVLGWMLQEMFVKEVIEQNGQGNHQENALIPSGLPICYTGFMIADKSISPRSMANLEQQRDKEHNSFP